VSPAVTNPPVFDAAVVRALVFDLDGTLVDSYGPIAASLNRARTHFDLPPLSLEAVRASVGHGLESLIADLVGPDRVDHGVQLFREHYARVFGDGTRVLDGVRGTLSRLTAAGYRMAVASNKPARFSTPILERLELVEAFQCILGPDSVDSHKPEPTMLRTCMERLGVERTATVYVGDMVLDVETAGRAGVPVLLVPGGSSTTESLTSTGQTVLPSFEALGELLSGA